MLEWLEAHELLWNSKSMEFKNMQEQNCLWDKQANDMGKPMEHIKLWWKAIRDSYTRLHKLKSGAAARTFTERDVWIMTNVHFFSSIVTHRGHPVKSVSIMHVIFFIQFHSN